MLKNRLGELKSDCGYKTDYEALSNHLRKINFQYNGVDIEYYRDDNVEDGDEDDGYGRNSTIEDEHVDDINYFRVAQAICFDRMSLDTSIMDLYCVERILRLNISKSDFDINVEGGYYGEEINGVNLTEGAIKKISDILINYISIIDNNFEKIRWVLKEEYGYLLDKINTFNKITEQKINIEDIIFPQEEYHKKVIKEDNKYYDMIGYENGKNYAKTNIILGVCYKTGDKYKVIDGYHRITLAKQAGIKKIKIWVLEE